jgi:polyadenylate-binding protein
MTSPAPAATPVATPQAVNTTAQAAPVVYASASLYVGDLDVNVTEANLFDTFSTIGPVASVRVCRDSATRRSLGYAYVNYHRVEDAEKALDGMNFTTIRNRACRIMWSHRDPSLRKSGQGNIFVKNLAKNIDNKILYDTFSVFGNILSCKVATNAKRESLGYGFVHFESDEQGQSAIKSVNKMAIGGQQVEVMPFKSKRERGGTDSKKFTNVFVKNLPEETTKDELDTIFSKYGKISSSYIGNPSEPKDKKDQKEGSQNETKDAVAKDEKAQAKKLRARHGFVNFENYENALAAVEALNNKDYKGRQLYVSRAQKREEREKELREKFEQVKLERQKKYAGVNLYVKNLGETVDDERLAKEFGKFGNITKAKVMSDDKGSQKGFGFVCFSTSEEATKAVTEMNGAVLDGKPLYVALAQRREVRRAQLEAQYARQQKINMNPAIGYPNPNPFYYQPMPAPNQRFYQPGPQPMMRPPRWNPQQQPQQNMQGAPIMMQQRPVYQLMPVQQGQRTGGGMTRGGRGGQRGGRGGMGKPTGMGRGGSGRGVPQMGQQGQQQVRFQGNAQNVMRPQNQSSQNQQPEADGSVQAAPADGLKADLLAQFPPETQKQMIGERLFPLIQTFQPERAGKITGMLLEMDVGELLHLLESPALLQEKITEAIRVLEEAGQGEEESEDGSK